LILVAAAGCRSRGPAQSQGSAKPATVPPRAAQLAHPAPPPSGPRSDRSVTTAAPPTTGVHANSSPITQAPQGPRPPRGTMLSLMFSGNGQGEIEPCG
jgi:hypothetical protein